MFQKDIGKNTWRHEYIGLPAITTQVLSQVRVPHTQLRSYTFAWSALYKDFTTVSFKKYYALTEDISISKFFQTTLHNIPLARY